MGRKRPSRSAPRAGPAAGDSGSALVEFVYLAILLMVPLVYVMLTVFQVQSAAFAATEAARQAGRAFVRADDRATADRRAAAASRLAFADQGIRDAGPPVVTCPDPDPCLTPGTRVRVQVTYRVRLLFLGGLFGHGRGATIPVTATHEQVVDRYRGGP